MDYRHVQKGKIAGLVALFGLIVTAIVLATGDGAAWIAVLAAFVVIFGIVLIFSRLTVKVAAGEVVAAFGWGWPRRVVDIRDIDGFRPVRNHAIYGWGIRWVPGGWMFNVWGLDAVELQLRSGRHFRIGTDEPDRLLAALAAHTSQLPDA